LPCTNSVAIIRNVPQPFRFIASMPRLTQPVTRWRDEVRRIEDLGFSAVAISDHFTHGWVMDPIVAMTVAAEATSTLRVLSLVLGNDYRHPALLHKSLATLDVISGGRVEIGLGAGWMPDDYTAAGIPFDPPGVRVERLGEAIEVLRGLFSGNPLVYQGKHYQITELDGLPKPVQLPHPPLLVGGGSRRVLELAGRAADIVGINASMRERAGPGRALLDLTADGVAGKLALARDAARTAGRDPGALRYQISILSLHVTDVPDARPWVSSLAAGVTEPDVLAESPAVLHGSVAECVDLLQRRREEYGLDYIQLGGDLSAAAPIVARLAGT
jgi:probable F420-dependent oxidoreductase